MKLENLTGKKFGRLTNKTQQNNRTNNRFIEFNGEKHTQKEWAEITKIHQRTISYRLERGWSIEDALTKPVQSTGGRLNYDEKTVCYICNEPKNILSA